ncbi:MAG: hypothetical protein J6B57_10740 [Oscillospiraceae bacterium]|nr:hypothetical protein [Oscillospiraceae bacterium]
MPGFILVIGSPDCILPADIPAVYAEKVLSVDCPECAVLVWDGAEIPCVSRAAGVMINGDSAGAFPAERLSGVQLITCGRGAKNTVSVTSDDGETLTLALNRAVATPEGVCEPMELPVRRGGRSEYGCMAEFAAGVILGLIG